MLDRLARLCAHATDLAASRNWSAHTLVMSCEFETLDGFLGAYRDLDRAAIENGFWVPPCRGTSPDIVEMEIMGVTFRLVCRQKQMWADGVMGAADLIGSKNVIFSEDFLALRKGAGY